MGEALKALPAAAPRLVLGFTPDVARYMQLADFFIGKPGPGSVSEAVQMQLPVIVVRNRYTLPQERYNTHWVREQGVGIVCPSYAKVDEAVAQMLRRLPELRAATAAVRNRAVFEVPEILRGILRDANERFSGSPLRAGVGSRISG